MSSKLEPVIWLRDTGHIGIHGGVDGQTYVRTDVEDVMAIKPNFLTSMGYHIFLAMVLRARAPKAPLRVRCVSCFKLLSVHISGYLTCATIVMQE